ncbi:MAG: monofunctional biosynthetic peptidoglycan transglycosylase [Myxococcota bacterium]
MSRTRHGSGLRPIQLLPQIRVGARGSRVLALLGRALAVFVVSSVGAVVLLRWVDPWTSAFMIESRIAAAARGERGYRTDYRWVDYEKISPNVAIAVVASEDQKFPRHAGFDLDSIADAIEASAGGGPMRGASTISQQVAKNLFLWPGRSFVRKGIEAWFTVLLETLWPKRRILEVYLNVAEFGPGGCGGGAASARYFGTSPARVGGDEAARLAAVLPAPRNLHADRPSAYVRSRSARIAQEMARLGGPGYLRSM